MISQQIKKLITLLLFAFLAACTQNQNREANIGYRQFTLSDTLTEAEVEVALWYPTAAPAKQERVGSLTADLALDADPNQTEGLIVLSHGFAGDSFSHSDTAVFLAQSGFLVATPTYPDLAGVESTDPEADPLVMRPRITALIIEHLLNDDTFKNSFDPQNVGVIGYSIGAYTALTTMGAMPTFDNLGPYCENVPTDEILCADWAEARFSAIDNRIESQADLPIQAGVLLAPAYGPLFNAQSLEAVDVPIKIYQAEQDEELVEPYHTAHLISTLPQSPEHALIADAGHFVFLAPCPSSLKNRMPQFCTDPESVDREAIHEKMNAEIAQFFTDAFNDNGVNGS